LAVLLMPVSCVCPSVAVLAHPLPKLFQVAVKVLVGHRGMHHRQREVPRLKLEHTEVLL